MIKLIKVFAWIFLALGTIILGYFTIKSFADGYYIGFKNETNYTITGQFGDFVGGVVGTLFTLTGTILIYLSFRQQTKENLRTTFESSFFEMIRLHRENIGELKYIKPNHYNSPFENRQVLQVIFREFIDCYRDVKKYSRNRKAEDFIRKDYLEKLLKIKAKNECNFKLSEMAFIDIAFSIVFYGVGTEGESVLRNNFRTKYNSEYYFRLLFFIKLKPKEENERYQFWREIRGEEVKYLRSIIDEAYEIRSGGKKGNKEYSFDALRMISRNDYQKYYGGHQFRLSHYFRHLFQSFKYIDTNEHLSEKEKYSYAKMLRGQLSTYEQALLFINSVSSLGMKWEYLPEKLNGKEYNPQLISNYNLIKNLPGKHFYGIKFDRYYPKVDYENNLINI